MCLYTIHTHNYTLAYSLSRADLYIIIQTHVYPHYITHRYSVGNIKHSDIKKIVHVNIPLCRSINLQIINNLNKYTVTNDVDHIVLMLSTIVIYKET